MAFLRLLLTAFAVAVPLTVVMFIAGPHFGVIVIPIWLICVGALGLLGGWMTEKSPAWRCWILGDD